VTRGVYQQNEQWALLAGHKKIGKGFILVVMWWYLCSVTWRWAFLRSTTCLWNFLGQWMTTKPRLSSTPEHLN